MFLTLCLLMTSGFVQPAVASDDVEDVAALERQVESAYLRSDLPFLRKTLREDFRFSHGTGTVEGKEETLTNFAKEGNFLSRTLTSVDVEVHGDVALTSGRIEIRSSVPTDYTICYMRLYHRDGGGPWKLVSHRTYRQASGFDETCAPR